MGVQLNSNVGAVSARRQTDRASNNLSTTQEQLSSLLRINSALDDAAGLAIAEGFNTQVRELNQEVDNLQSGSNLLETADSSLGEQSEAVSRIRELATQAASGTLNDDQRAAINAEAQQLVEQIDATAAQSEFNGVNALDNGDQTIALDANGTQIEVHESTSESLGLDDLDLSTQAGAQAAIGALDSAQENINSNRAEIGAQ